MDFVTGTKGSPWGQDSTWLLWATYAGTAPQPVDPGPIPGTRQGRWHSQGWDRPASTPEPGVLVLHVG